jgi:3-oxoacyl-[acyl-carrier-protein] synthase II
VKRRVVITGGAVISALGNEWPDILNSLRAGKNFVRYMKDWEKYARMNTMLAVPVDFAMPDYPRKKVRSLGRVAQLALVSADRALASAGISADDPELKNGRAGVAYGSSMGSIEPLLDFYSLLILNDVSKISSTTYIKAMPQTCAANIGVFFGLTGRIITTNTACTSSSQAIGFAYETIARGAQDLMLAGGAEEMSPANAAVFDTLFAASCKNETPEKTPAAYDKNRDGLVVGEGAGTLILEEYEHAKKRGAKIYAEVAGYGMSGDAHHITAPAENGDGGVRAMKAALKDADMQPADIDYINAHGTSTGLGDISELTAVKTLFPNACMSSTKSMTGHLLGAAGAVGAIFATLALRDNIAPPTINLTDPADEVGDFNLVPNIAQKRTINAALSNSFGFGGTNAALVFKKI